ncbi:MAG TPA: hypothetical protein PLV06_06395 [Bacteroidales bacterium]|nr:hypothetical protein [Bacteroidales bacterium]HPJ60143.1 hypothetical protein [Bacteroidales bacterium]HPR11998.1 hypothetical protein [Bacteroidales bacterium]HRW86672.1 hypothetical protein [Bacteroidales bacterium]
MAAPNEVLIRNVFKEILKYRPSIQKMLVADEEEEESTDPRFLGDLIIRSLPWPIGVELRRLFSASTRQLDRMRLDQIFKTIERSMQFISFVMICQLWRDVKDKNLILPDGFRKEFSDRIPVLSMGNFTWLIRAVGNLMNEKDIPWFMPEMGENFDKKFYAALDFWVPERNEIGHYQINLNNEEIEKRCVEYEEKLSFILEKLSFIAKYKLVSVREIRVIHPKNQSAKFNHLIDVLSSSDSGFRAQELEQTRYTESNSVLLMKSLKTIEEYLNLSPLVIDTNSEVIDDKEKFDIKKDIFMYTKYRGDQLMYVGTEVTEKCDLRSLHNYQNLVDQFRDMLATISG